MGNNSKNDTDVDLLFRFKNGEEEAFLELYNKYKTPILNYIYRSCQDRSMAEDITQEIFLKVFRGAKNYRPQGKISSWIYTISTHVLWKRMKKERRLLMIVNQKDSPDLQEDLLSRIEDTRVQSPLEKLEEKQGEAAVRKAIESLPLKQRQAVVLSVYQQLSYKDIGQALEVSEGAVKVMIHRAKKTLKKRLSAFITEQGS